MRRRTDGLQRNTAPLVPGRSRAHGFSVALDATLEAGLAGGRALAARGRARLRPAVDRACAPAPAPAVLRRGAGGREKQSISTSALAVPVIPCNASPPQPLSRSPHPRSPCNGWVTPRQISSLAPGPQSTLAHLPVHVHRRRPPASSVFAPLPAPRRPPSAIHHPPSALCPLPSAIPRPVPWSSLFRRWPG
jgi:hypothetical protein